MKWKDYSSEENTWEPSENLGCFKLIQEFENERRLQRKCKKRENSRKISEVLIISAAAAAAEKANMIRVSQKAKIDPYNRPIATVAPSQPVIDRVFPPPPPRELPKIPELIHGAAMIGSEWKLTFISFAILIYLSQFTDKLMLLVKWKYVKLSTLEPNTKMNLMCPQLVIDFYERSLVFED